MRLATILGLSLLAGSASLAAPLASWSFRQAADAKGWEYGDLTAPPTVSKGALRFAAGVRDPQIYSPRVHFATGPYQHVELRLASSRPGTAELFWAPTDQGPYGGFGQGRSLRFYVAAGAARDYVLYPFWHADKEIVRLRFDPPDGGKIALHFLRVTESSAGETKTTRWDFRRDKSLGGWTAAQGLEPLVLHASGLETRSNTDSPLLLSPRVNLPAEEAHWATIQMRAPGLHGEVWAITDQPPGVVKQPFTFGLIADSPAAWRTYNIPLSFGGHLIGLALRPTDRAGQPLLLESVALGSNPAGKPSLREVYTYLDDSLPRVGRATDLVCVVTNTGAEPASHLSARAGVPDGIELLAPAQQAGPASLAFGARHTFRWRVVARKRVDGTAEITVSADRSDGCRCAAGLLITAAPQAAKRDYVPEPEPVRGPYEIGMYYFPGWNDASRWDPIRSACFPRPVLGYYREGEPEVADWHIKWAVEHGLDFFIYDWYWSQGAMQLTHGLDGYFKSRYHRLLKFCLLWANHNAPGTSSEADLLAVTRFWIENYFERPEYKTVDGKPLMVIFAPGRLREDMGSAAVRAAFDKMRALCREAGLPGLYLVACAWSPGEMARLAEEGYDAVSAYTYPEAGAHGGLWAPYADMVTGFEALWREFRAAQKPPYIATVAPGWDNRPWAGDRALVRYGSTPAKFRTMCENAKRLLDRSKGIESRMLLVEAWNEWGEGAYAEPAGRWQFGYLDALRDVFTNAPQAHLDLGPRDVGLGPYDVTWPEPQTAWEFDRDGDLEGWTGFMQLADVEVKGGSLRATSIGDDPALSGPPLRLDAARYRRVEVRLRVSRAAMAQLFWSTDFFATSEATSATFHTTIAGEFHTYTLDVAANPTWTGTVRSLRLDPTILPGVRIEVDYLRVVP